MPLGLTFFQITLRELYSALLMIVVIFGNMVEDAFLSAMVVTREFGFIGELFHKVFQSAISSVAWWPGGAGGANAPPAGLKNGGATEHKGRLKTERL